MQGLGVTLEPGSPLVSFQAETLTGREKFLIWVRNNPSFMLPDHCTSMGGTCEQRRLSPGSRRLSQGPRCMIGELPIKSSARRKFGSAYSNLQVYKTHHITGHTFKELTKCQLALESEQHKRNSVQYIPSYACSNFQVMLLDLEHPALAMGNPVTSSLHGKVTTSVSQNIPNSS